MATAAQYDFKNGRFEVPRRLSVRNARDLRSRVRRALQHGERQLVVDCHAWQQIDVSMLSSLIQCAAACREHGASFEVANLSREIRAGVHALQLNERLGLRE